MRHVEIIRKRLRQKWHGRFVGDNGRTLAHTENYTNLLDLNEMLAKYFPDWRITTR